MLHFDSDYMEGACPEIIKVLVDSNLEQTIGYGLDEHSRHAKELILKACGLEGRGEVHFLIGGTQTNATVIDALLSHHEGVLAAESAHINVHEAGAVEATGHKVLVLPAKDGKISADAVANYVDTYYKDETYEHIVAPGMVYISYPTEYGTLYSLDELQALSRVCRDRHIPLYLDGARLGYGLTSPESDVTLGDIARLTDVFYIGGTKVGALFGEAVVSSRKGLLPHFFSLTKQHGALLAKGRLLGIQFETLFGESDGELLYTRISRHAVALALRLKEALTAKGYKLHIDSPTNQQFFVLPNDKIDQLLPKASFELWGARCESETPVRFVTSWATSDEAVEELILLFH